MRVDDCCRLEDRQVKELKVQYTIEVYVWMKKSSRNMPWIVLERVTLRQIQK